MAQLIKIDLEVGVLEYHIIVAAIVLDLTPLQFLAPYSGCIMGKYFWNNGIHTLSIYYDLSKQLVAYRQMSLLLCWPLGHDAFPGDVFYLHSCLLERIVKMLNQIDVGSLIALPIIKTQVEDMFTYIPTNVISITDGQIFLETYILKSWFRFIINIGLYVNHVSEMRSTWDR